MHATGKTTVMKQMRLITNASFTARELESYRQLVFSNLITGMKALVECLPEVDLNIDGDAEALQSYQVSTLLVR
jgi:guanine nucleotide-binding protein subunit alpha, other